MKKIIFTSCLLITFLIVSGCSNSKNQTERSDDKQEESTAKNISQESSKEYINTNLGIKFQYPEGFENKAIEQGNKILYPEWSPTMYIAVFGKPENEKIEDSIIGIMKQDGKSPKNCIVVDKGKYWANPKYEVFALDLANQSVSYSEEELEEIKRADIETEKDGGPFNGEWKKREIYNKRLVDNCSEYAEPLGLGTSKTIGSMFLYNEILSKTKFIFLPGTSDPYFHKEGTIDFMKE